MANVSFRGNVGKVFGLKRSQDGKPRFQFSVAESHGRFDQHNQWQDTGTTWWNVTVFGKQSENLADIIQEGQKQQVVVTGRSQTRRYEHNGEQRESLDVAADHVGLVHRANQPQSSPAANWNNAPENAWAGGGQQQGGNPPF
ncbi:single-stranded DNA-binding protein [Auritidibacter ignavus]|uniref:Single-stranded DNA-binding protein n=1 Tax=Auritidibacter ignavus TaxID=678932 RepID=A0AAJ6AK11_9MICC|nr:single-stranded DNA-binding protein [Auritidibacter ignavus]NIH72241.1 single-strand DNA-binding protein [Auritidibacter ignavus]WGH82508.1 single-stranded DNA-binding protein [Auritidibacter ignavus]WGH87072.1 single-stranded DNA-binding protein [Auritidibacter ignavus]WGH89356.1 single-stranded DNA-binding protein [Auritidibacter ignavus]WGH91699.1 single-stranded DNA-binding protein [Auritidibacter ignavus]